MLSGNPGEFLIKSGNASFSSLREVLESIGNLDDGHCVPTQKMYTPLSHVVTIVYLNAI